MNRINVKIGFKVIPLLNLDFEQGPIKTSCALFTPEFFIIWYLNSQELINKKKHITLLVKKNINPST